MGPEGNISAEGYKNIGTLGNIRLTSTFGNIGLFTKENKLLYDFEQPTTVIPWNPSYLKQVALMGTMVPDFDEDMILKDISAPTDLAGLLSFLQEMLLYDGFPTFLPCRMIMQNPNIEAPTDNWLSKFRSIDDNWTRITNTAYWKSFSNVMGNITLDSWSGDIDLHTKGTLGNAGNINILANNKYGSLPEYSVANINMKANTPFRIYTDPRDLFLDTHLLGKLTGKFAWFSNASAATGPADKPIIPPKTPPAIVQKPLQPVQLLLSLLGVPFEFGFASETSNGGGCMQCITDVITQVAADLHGFEIAPWVLAEQLFLNEPKHHKFNAVKGSLMHPDIIGGSVSLLTQDSNGYGHAVDKCRTGRIICI
jgi:hypothetical protein